MKSLVISFLSASMLPELLMENKKSKLLIPYGDREIDPQNMNLSENRE